MLKLNLTNELSSQHLFVNLIYEWIKLSLAELSDALAEWSMIGTVYGKVDVSRCKVDVSKAM